VRLVAEGFAGKTALEVELAEALVGLVGQGEGVERGGN